MNVYQLALDAEDEFVVVAPSLLAVLILQARQAHSRSFRMARERLLEPALADYLLAVINGNRRTRACFRFREITCALEMPELCDILARQLLQLTIGQEPCFESVRVCAFESTITCGEGFSRACKDEGAVYLYQFSGGHRVRLDVGA